MVDTERDISDYKNDNAFSITSKISTICIETKNLLSDPANCFI